MESWLLRRAVFILFIALIPFSCAIHYPVVAGRVAGPLSWFGFFMFVLSLAFAFYVHSMFPRSHKRPGDFERLLTDGPYRYVRHPFYAAFIVMGFGVALWCLSIPGLIAYTLMLPLWEKVAKIEERELLNYWGDRYREFMEVRGRFFPRRISK
ncbi:isoprenylcysteine carboxylmethyltransferase family protein [Thermococcus sp.]|uniref:methyltransferase family protein n=1 Tax=Thermococcus sp. TaxID=35749 RepID=UPI0025D3F21A|nr:isoprenylcysteine carboxylmethyltransferase family protein [Thermococcus sp.]